MIGIVVGCFLEKLNARKGSEARVVKFVSEMVQPFC